MPVRVPFNLIRREVSEPCDALLLLATDVRELLTLCGRLGTDPLPPIFSVAGGFLLLTEERPVTLPPRTLRLRRLSENCFLPVDADLVPALYPEEAADMCRQRGLVFLPGSQCLAFQPDKPLSAVAFLSFSVLKREDYRPFPVGPELAKHLTVITRVVPEITPDDIFDAGKTGIGEELPPRPPKVGPIKTTLGILTLGLGKGVLATGAVLGVGALAWLGAKLIGAAVAAVPRLSEALLGKQEAALRELLRKFREGKTDEALKNALPMNAGAGGNLHASDQLPTHDINWSLSALAGSGQMGSIWVGGQDLQRDLINEYRKAAQAALAQGDHRRAAFIYAKLLGELHTAADILAKGGLHRDAAIVYRDLLNEPRWAAREFEAAGEMDEALRLYLQIGDHEQAGDLLRRKGEEELAVEEYHVAARKIVDEQRDYLKAGDLLLRKTGRADLAGAYFAIGWRNRGDSINGVNNAVPCSIRLAEIYAFGDPLDSLWTLIDEAEAWLDGPAQVSDCASFFNVIGKLADLAHLKDHRVALRDRAKLALAAKLRAHTHTEARPGNVVSSLFGSSGLWPAAVVSDANFALRVALKGTTALAKIERPFSTVRLATGTVTAAAYASQSGGIFIGMSDGAVVGYHPGTGRITPIKSANHVAVESIAIEADGQAIVTASASERLSVHLHGYRLNDSDKIEYKAERKYPFQIQGCYLLSPLILRMGSAPTTFLSTPAGVVEFHATVLIPRESFSSNVQKPPCYLVLPEAERSRSHFPYIAVEDRVIQWSGETLHTGWRPQETGLNHPLLSWLRIADDQLEIAGIMNGAVHWTEAFSPVSPTGERSHRVRTRVSLCSKGYQAAANWKARCVVCVTGDNRVCWLRERINGFEEWADSTTITVPTKAVACFPSHATNEVIVILADGDAVRVPAPT